MDLMREICDIIRMRVLDQQSALLNWTGDITRLDVDAVVNAANPTLLGGGGVDAAIHQTAGPKLLQACRDLPLVTAGVRCPIGQAKLTPAFDLPATHVIHTVGPRWTDGEQGEPALLADAYTACMTIALERRFQSIAFPAISTGVYGFPKTRAQNIATDVVHRMLSSSSQTLRVIFVHFES
jgi:O-acetyl-ADP-ribose deacetylase (regulator of RNase III)